MSTLRLSRNEINYRDYQQALNAINLLSEEMVDGEARIVTYGETPNAKSIIVIKRNTGITQIDIEGIGDTIPANSKRNNSQVTLNNSKNEQLFTIPYATETYAGVMSASDKAKLNNVENGATNVVVDTELSSTSTNAIQNAVVANELNNRANAISYHNNSDGSITLKILYNNEVLDEIKTFPTATSTTDGLMSKSDKQSLTNMSGTLSNKADGIVSSPDYDGDLGVYGVKIKLQSNGTDLYNAETFITQANQDTCGVMSADDKTKLDGISAGANKTIVKEELFGMDFLDYRNIGFFRPNGTQSDSSSYRYSDYIEIEDFDKLYIHICVGSVSVSPAVFYDENLNYISGVTPTVTTETDITVDVPSTAKYVICSCLYSKVSVFKMYGEGEFTNKQKSDILYISPNGTDTNSGISSTSPIFSFNAAKNKLKPNGTLVFLEGDYENYQFDISWFTKIIGRGNVRFINYLQKITNAELVDGYTKVYSTQLTSRFAVTSQGEMYHSFIYQHDIEDNNTSISASDIHPLHKGRTKRLSSTRLYKVNSISEIENNTLPSFYYDNTTTTLYFSKVTGSSLESNPIIIPHTTPLTASQIKQVNIDNINILYKNILTTYISGVISNVSIGMCFGIGAFRLDNTTDLTLINCEAYACENDGFNTHNTLLDITPVTNITMINCYGHDNSDDGESCHEYSLVTQYGGLYEFNGNGCTPATGGKGVYHNVLVRYNGNHDWVTDDMGTGFSCQGVETQPTMTTMECYNCVSEYNKYGFNNTNGYGMATVYNCIGSNNSIIDFTHVTVKNNFTASLGNKADGISTQPNSDNVEIKLNSGSRVLATAQINNAGEYNNGLMSASDYVKLTGIEAGANKTVVDSALSSTSENPVQNKVVKTALDGKVDNVALDVTAGGLELDVLKNGQHTYLSIPYVGVDNDFPDGLMFKTDKDKLDGIEAQANKTIVDSTLNSTSENPVQNKVVKTALDGKGSVLDSTELEWNEAGGDVGYIIHLSNETTLLSSTTIPYASKTYGGIMSLDDKNKLDGIKAGANKTVVDSALSSTSENPVQNKVVNAALDNKISKGLTLTVANQSNNNNEYIHPYTDAGDQLDFDSYIHDNNGNVYGYISSFIPVVGMQDDSEGNPLPGVMSIQDKTNLDNVVTEIATKTNKQSVVTINDSTQTTLNLEINKYYNIKHNVNTLNIKLPTINNSSYVENIEMLFKTGTTPNIDFGTSINYYEQDGMSTYEQNTTYKVNCLWNGDTWVITRVKLTGPHGQL